MSFSYFWLLSICTQSVLPSCPVGWADSFGRWSALEAILAPISLVFHLTLLMSLDNSLFLSTVMIQLLKSARTGTGTVM